MFVCVFEGVWLIFCEGVFFFVGGGSCIFVLCVMVEDVGVLDVVIFLGELEGEQFVLLYCMVDVYVSMLMVDGSLILLLEVMVSGVVFVVIDILGNC